jgi:hypothetical protein
VVGGRRLTGLVAAGAVAVALLAPSSAGARGPLESAAASDVSMRILSASPRPPKAGSPFELVARVDFVPAPGSLHCSVWIGGKRQHAQRLRWESPIGRCSLRLPPASRGKRLTIALRASLGPSTSRVTLGFRIA